jgi:hypothetical protein
VREKEGACEHVCGASPCVCTHACARNAMGVYIDSVSLCEASAALLVRDTRAGGGGGGGRAAARAKWWRGGTEECIAGPRGAQGAKRGEGGERSGEEVL